MIKVEIQFFFFCRFVLHKSIYSENIFSAGLPVGYKRQKCKNVFWTLRTTNVQFPCLWTDLNNFFSSLTWKFDGDSKSDVVLSLKSLSGPQMSNFLVMDRFQYFFPLTWKFDGNSKYDIVLSLK